MKDITSELECLEARMAGMWGHARDVLKTVSEDCILPDSQHVQAILRIKRDMLDTYKLLDDCQLKLTPPLIEAAE